MSETLASLNSTHGEMSIVCQCRRTLVNYVIIDAFVCWLVKYTRYGSSQRYHGSPNIIIKYKAEIARPDLRPWHIGHQQHQILLAIYSKAGPVIRPLRKYVNAYSASIRNSREILNLREANSRL